MSVNLDNNSTFKITKMEKKDKPFQIRSYGHAELGQLYNPNLSKENASRRLRNWIAISKTLSAKLAETSYQKYTKVLTPKQVELIIECLGEP